jgi:hypothetical protein
MCRIGVLGLSALCVIASSVACGGGSPASPDSPGGSPAQGLSGTWQATRAEFVNAANSSVRIEVVSLGTVIVLTLDPSGTYTQRITDPGQQGTTETGTWSSSRDVLTLRRSANSNTQFDYALSGNTLTLSGGHALFDVNDDGVAEEAILNAVLTRQ